MGRDIIEISKEGLADLSKIKKSSKKTDISKLEKIFLELETHPMLRIGKPEKLKHKDLLSGLNKSIKKIDYYRDYQR